jgi:hypothetical protein
VASSLKPVSKQKPKRCSNVYPEQAAISNPCKPKKKMGGVKKEKKGGYTPYKQPAQTPASQKKKKRSFRRPTQQFVKGQ